MSFNTIDKCLFWGAMFIAFMNVLCMLGDLYSGSYNEALVHISAITGWFVVAGYKAREIEDEAFSG